MNADISRAAARPQGGGSDQSPTSPAADFAVWKKRQQVVAAVVSWTSFDLARYIATTAVLAWIAFAIVRSQKAMLVSGHGWQWVTLSAAAALCHWPINFWLSNPLICPIVVSLLYLLSLVGLAPDDTVLTADATPVSQWFQRGLVAAMGGTVGGVMIWTLHL